ncbi:MAG: GAF domain-containing protein [Anaerolineales bacterium]
MQENSRNELKMLATAILRLVGVCLLLVPSYLRVETEWLPSWTIPVLALACYILSLVTQVFFVNVLSEKKQNILRYTSGVFLLIVAVLFLHPKYVVEASIVAATGIVQLLPVIFHYQKLEKINPILIVVPTLGFFNGLYIIFAGQQYDEINVFPYKHILIITLLFTSFVGTIPAFYPHHRLSKLLFQVQAIPWVVWCSIFLYKTSFDHAIVPALFALNILLVKTIPWSRFTLPEHDILGKRVIMVTSTIELTLLIFLSALLTLIDYIIMPGVENILKVREATLLFFVIISIILFYEISTIVMTINGLMIELKKVEDDEDEEFPNLDFRSTTWNERIARYLKPFTLTRENVRVHLNAQTDQINSISKQLNNEKKRNKQLVLLHELSQQLENHLDQPVSAQLAVNTLEKALNSSLASLYVYEPDDKNFLLIATSGPQSSIVPSEYRQSMSASALGRAARQRKTQIINDTRLDSDYISFAQENSLSCAIVPMIFNGYVNGMIVINDENVNAFGSLEIGLIESVAAELTRSWERSGYQKRLMNLVQSGSQLSSMVEPDATANEVAAITKEILQARFTFVHIQLGQEENFIQTASSGDAPQLLSSLETSNQDDPLIQAAFHATKPFRVRDVRKYSDTSHLSIDHNSLRSMLAIPIRWHRLSIGSILAFGKQNEVFFSENDESLAELLSIQAAGAFESTWLQQELRASLRTTSLLYRLSTHIIQAENLQDAARDIAQTAHKLAKGQSTGIILFSQESLIEAELEVDNTGIHSGTTHPMELIQQVMDSGQLIYMSQGKSMIRACLPIQTPIHKYGALWINIPDNHQHKPASPADLQTLVNQAAIALERSLLLVESRRQANEIKNAYDMLEVTYDQTLVALTSALDARDRETEGHSMRVSRLVAKLGEALNFSHEQLKLLERGSLLHDIGKIGIRDTILHKPGPLDEEEWKIMRQHPDIGARIVKGIPFLEDTIPLIRHHQERWDGSGYPLGLKGEEIPLLARMFAIVDAFDALTSHRPYREKISIEEAVSYLREQAGLLFDPLIVDAFAKLILENPPDFKFIE